MILYGPVPFILQVFKSRDSTLNSTVNQRPLGYWDVRAGFSESIFFKAYVACAVLFETVIPILSLFTLNIISLVKLKKIQTYVSDGCLRSITIRITRLIIVLTFISLFARLLDFLVNVLRFQLKWLWEVEQPNEAFLSQLQDFSFLLLLTAHSLDGLFYYFYDRHVESTARDLIKNIAHC